MTILCRELLLLFGRRAFVPSWQIGFRTDPAEMENGGSSRGEAAA